MSSSIRGESRRRKYVSARRGHRIILETEALEDRLLLSVFPVTSTADDGSTGTLRWAVQQADVAGITSSIEIELGTTAATITLSQGVLDVTNTRYSVTIYDGPGQGPVSISGNGASQVFRVNQNVTASISGVTIMGGSANGDGGYNSNGGGIYNQGDLTLTGCTISGNSAQEGGGIDNIGTATLNGCKISGNTASSGSGIADDGSLTLESTVSVSGGVFASGSGSITVTGSSNKFSGALMVASGALDVFSGLDVAGGASLAVNGAVRVSGDMTIGGTLSIAGDLTMTSTATLNEQIGDALGSGQVGQIDVSGSAALDGTFILDLVDGFAPSIGQDFTVLTYASAAGTFTAINGLSQGMIADQTPAAFYLDMPALPSISWTNPNGGYWDVPTNWSTGVVPTSSDVVSIDTSGAATITIQSGDDIQVQSLTTGDDDTLSITGGSLTVTAGISTLSGPLTITGGTLTANGSGVNLTANGATSISSASLFAKAGADLSLPQLTTYTSDSNTSLQAEGLDSVLDLSALTSQIQAFGNYCDDDATSGGTLNLNGLTSLIANGRIGFTDTDGSTILDSQLTGINPAEDGSIAVSIDGTDPQFDQSWTIFSNAYLFISGGQNALPLVTNVDGSEFMLSNGASLALRAVTTLDSDYSDFAASGAGGELDLSDLTSVTMTGSMYFDVTDGATLDLSSLTSLSSTQSLDITDTGNSTLEDGNLTDLSGVGVTFDGTDPRVASAWRSFSGSITLTGGTLTLPQLTTANFSELEVGAGTTLDLPLSTVAVTDTGETIIRGTLDVAGHMTLSPSATLFEQIDGVPDSGLNGQINIGGAATLAGAFNLELANGFTPSTGQDFTVLTYASAAGTFAAVNGLPQGMIADEGAISFDLVLPANATIFWTNPGSGDWDVAANWSTGVVPSSSDVVGIDMSGTATITIQPGDEIEVQTLTTGSNDTLSITGGSLTITAGQSILDGPLSMTGGLLTATGSGVDLTVNGATTISAASLSAAGGANLNVPQMTSFVSNGSTFQADGANSELNVSALTSVTQQGRWDIDATHGGTIDLGRLTNLTSTAGIAVTDIGDSTIFDGKLTELNGVDITLDGTDTQVAGAWRSFGGSITLTGGSDTLANVTSANFSAINLAAGSTLNLSSSAVSVASTGNLTIGAGSVLNVAGNLAFTAASAIDEQISGTPASGQFGSVIVGGTVTLAGSFNLDLLGAFASSVGQDFPVITFATATGAFSTVTGLTEPGSAFIEELNTHSMDLVGAPPPPAFTADTPPTGVANSLYSYQFQASAAGAPTITFSATGLPSWAELNSATGLLSGTPTIIGTYDFSVTASDGTLPNTTVNVSLLVAGGNAVTINVDAGADFTVPAGSYTGGTTFNVGAGAMVAISSGNAFTGGVVFNVASSAIVDLTGTGTPSYSGTLTGTGEGTVELATGRLYIGTGGMTLDFPGNMFQWTGGTIDAGNGDLVNLGTMNLNSDLAEDFYNDGVLDNLGTITETGLGSLQLGTDGNFPATLTNEAGASYLIEGDGGIREVSDSGTAPGVGIENEGTIVKDSGTGTSYLSVLGSITNTGTIEADSGTVALSAVSGISQIAGSSLTAGTWNVENGATLQFPSGTKIALDAANLALSGSGATITGISGLTSNSGSFSLLSGADFATATSFANSGSLTVGAGSTFSVASNLTEGSGATLQVQIAGAPASGQVGQVAVSGTVTLAGTFTLNTANGFTGSPGQDFKAITFASTSGLFSRILGFGSTYSDAVNPTSFDVYAFQAPADLELSNVSGPATATVGQQSTVNWQVSNVGPALAGGSWQDSVYLSYTTSITSTSILLGTEPHTGNLAENGTYTGTWTGMLPAFLPGNYYFVVQVDSLYQVPDPNRSNNTLAAQSSLSIAIPTLSIGTPAIASFTATASNVYYELSAAAGSSFSLAMAGSPTSQNNAIYVSFNSLPTTYDAEFQSTLTQADPTLAVPATLGGNYYVLVHNLSGRTGSFSLTASTAGLTLLQASPSTVGNAGQATLSVSGLDLGPGTTFTLNGPSGSITGTTSPESGSTLAYVTFNLSGVAAGTYGLKAVSSDGTTSTLGGAVQVTAGGGPDLVATLIGDTTVRVGRSSVFYFQYANIGDDDAGAPLITLTSPAGVTMGLDASEPPAEVLLQFLGINQNGPEGVLPPGASFQIPVYFTVDVSDPFMIGSEVAGTSDSQTLDWQAVEPEISPAVTGAANWTAVYAQLEQMTGDTWGQYISMLDQYATLLPASVGDPSNPIDVLQFAVNQAVAAVSTSISGVAVGTAAGVMLAGNMITATNGTTGDIFATNILNDGSFVFPTVTAGSYTFSVPDDLIDGSSALATVNLGQAVTGVAVTLDPEVTLSGRITAGGVPVAGADFEVWTATGIVTDVQSEAKGSYSAIFAPGSYTVIVDADGFARDYSDVTFSAGSQSLNFALASESAASGTVSLSDGQAIQSVDVVGVLQGNEPLPYFSESFTTANFLLDSLAPGVYDFDISAPNYSSVSIPDVQIGQGQTVDLGVVQLSPIDPVASAIDLALKNTWSVSLLGYLNTYGAGTSATNSARQVVGEYLFGQGVASPFQTAFPNYTPGTSYTDSTNPNPLVNITDPTDVDSFQSSPTTKNALQQTLNQIINNGLQNLKAVTEWLKPYTTNGTIPPNLTLPLIPVMDALGLASWQLVLEGSPAAGYWDYTISSSPIAALLAGGVGSGGAAPSNAASTPDNRLINGSLVLSLACNGKITVTPYFSVYINDTFDFDPASWYATLLTLGGLAHLEGLDMTCDVPFHVGFTGPEISSGQFSVQPFNKNSCMSGDCVPAQLLACNPFIPGMSRDPNALLGPTGFGTLGFIQPSGTWLYTVDFENDGTVSAQDVTVTEQLSPNLDWSTFQLGSFGFGAENVSIPAGLTEYQTNVSYENTDGSSLDVRVDLNFDFATGLLTATFTSLDPATGETPTGVFDGFLYPESESPVGSNGYVQYTVQPEAGLATGAGINQQASVVFDTNAPLNTAIVTNTIDAAPPTSAVSALPATTTTSSFTVSWSGSDGAGPGIGDYNVYVSDNGGAFILWQSNTTATSATYAGQTGHAYAFYSVATDYLGIVQPTPSTPQATISVIIETPPPPPPLVTVTSSVVETIKVGKGKKAKKETVLLVDFSGALSAASADNAGAYDLASIIKVKTSGKGKNKKPATTKLGALVSMASAVYNPSNNSVTLTPRGKLTASKPQELIVNGLLVTDTLGRGIDGAGDGRSGSNFIGTIHNKTVAVGGLPLARTSERPATVTAAIDALLAHNELLELVVRSPRALREGAR
jgi:hypothetical protein